MTPTQSDSCSLLWWYHSTVLLSFSWARNFLQGTVVLLMGRGQSRLWKSLFTASCQAVWSRSQQLLKWNEPCSHRLILFFWRLAASQRLQRERHKRFSVQLSKGILSLLVIYIKKPVHLRKTQGFFSKIIKTREICEFLCCSKYVVFNWLGFHSRWTTYSLNVIKPWKGAELHSLVLIRMLPYIKWSPMACR